MLDGFRTMKFYSGGNAPSVSITKNGVTFTKSAAEILGRPTHVVFMVDERGKRIAIQASDKSNSDAMLFSRPEKDKYGIRWNNKELLKSVLDLMGWNVDGVGYRVDGEFIEQETALVFDLQSAARFETKG